MTVRPRGAIVAIAATLACVLTAGCGAGRSVESFCSTMDEHKTRYLGAMGQANQALEGGDLLGGGAQAVSALGDLQRMWEDLAKVAPSDITSDVEAIRDAAEQQLQAAQDAADNPLGAIASGLTSGLMNAGSYTRVDAYVREHCDA